MPATFIRLSHDVVLPLDAVTQTFAVLGKRGSGKTNTASVLAEGLVKAGLPIVYVDPVGVTWGLRYSRDGRGPGLPVIILGGEHADVPLEETGGAVIADFVIEHRQPVVLDLGLFSKGAQRRFMVDFAERLYHKNRDALHVMLDECDTFVPQRIDHGGERLVGAINDLVRKGRARGLGVTLISQRPALISKDVLTQVETLVAHRMTGPQDRDAVERWIEHNAEGGSDVLSSLQKLADGEAWVWSPSWLKKMVRTQVNLRETLDSSATPKAGERRAVPKHAAEVDLGALRERLAATIEKAKADDPRELRRRISELEKRLRSAPTAQAEPPKPVEVPLLTSEQTQHLFDLRGELSGLMSGIRQLDERFKALTDTHDDHRLNAVKAHVRVSQITDALGAALAARPAPAMAVIPSRSNGSTGARLRQIPQIASVGTDSEATDGSDLPRGERAILTAVAQNPGGATRDQVSALTGYKRQTRDEYISRLSRKGLVRAEHGAPVVATEEGLSALGPSFQPLPTGAALIEYWRSRLPSGERAILDVLVKAWPGGVTRDNIGEITGFKRQTRDEYISRLVRKKIVDKSHVGAPVCASAALMEST